MPTLDHAVYPSVLTAIPKDGAVQELGRGTWQKRRRRQLRLGRRWKGFGSEEAAVHRWRDVQPEHGCQLP